jgi:outer membrane protein OmpA-like peptidoglycan-associated protein
MKRFIICAMLVMAFGVFSNVEAQFKTPKMVWGFAAGGVHGANVNADEWNMQYRAFLQQQFAEKWEWQIGLGWLELSAPNVYNTQIGVVDARVLFSPISASDLNPYVYAGVGVAKTLVGGTSFMPTVPVGIGVQTKIFRGVYMNASTGYTLVISDKLDGIVRSAANTNIITNEKNDGYYGFTIGFSVSLGPDNDNPEDMKKLDAAEARRIKELAAAEAVRVKQQADAEAAAKLAKATTDADAKLAKETADAEARRLAEQKGADTVIVLMKGKTVVLRGVNFEFNKATLMAYSDRILLRAYNAMVANPNVSVVITGHTDNIGSQEFNQTLSLERAQTVRNWLVERGIASNRMRTTGRGFNEPVASNDTDEGRAQNRRIEFYVEQ